MLRYLQRSSSRIAMFQAFVSQKEFRSYATIEHWLEIMCGKSKYVIRCPSVTLEREIYGIRGRLGILFNGSTLPERWQIISLRLVYCDYIWIWGGLLKIFWQSGFFWFEISNEGRLIIISVVLCSSSNVGRLGQYWQRGGNMLPR